MGFGHGHGLRRAIGLAIFNAVDHRRSAIQHDAVRADVGDISRLVGQSDIDNIFVIRIDVKRTIIGGESLRGQLRFGSFRI